MKLYATTTSERAKKGQGGEWLEIEICDRKKKPIAYLLAEVRKDKHLGSEYEALFFRQTTREPWTSLLSTNEEQPKGNKQKGECAHEWDKSTMTCTKCGANY